MKVIERALALALLACLGSACGGSAAAIESDPANGPAETSEDELNTTARFTRLKKGPTNPALKAVWVAGGKLENSYLGVYRFNKAGPERTDPAAREKRIKEVMHRYMCSFFDEGIGIGRSSGPNALRSIVSDLDFNRNAEDDAKVAAFSTALGGALADTTLDVLSGSAGGNNTAGEVLGIYDTAKNEILFFGFTNCGSDN